MAAAQFSSSIYTVDYRQEEPLLPSAEAQKSIDCLIQLLVSD